MSLLVFSIPQDKLEYLQERINTFKNKVQELSGDPKEHMEARYSILEKFVDFLQKDVEQVEVFEMTNEGMDKRSAANIEISMAIDKGGNWEELDEETIRAKIKEAIKSPNAELYITSFPLTFSWWEGDSWKGIVKIPKV